MKSHFDNQWRMCWLESFQPPLLSHITSSIFTAVHLSLPVLPSLLNSRCVPLIIRHPSHHPYFHSVNHAQCTITINESTFSSILVFLLRDNKEENVQGNNLCMTEDMRMQPIRLFVIPSLPFSLSYHLDFNLQFVMDT